MELFEPITDVIDDICNDLHGLRTEIEGLPECPLRDKLMDHWNAILKKLIALELKTQRFTVPVNVPKDPIIDLE